MQSPKRKESFDRDLPQTPWLVDGERKAESSVEELILSEIRKHFKFEQARFCSSGTIFNSVVSFTLPRYW